MSEAAPAILLVCNPADLEEIEGMLEQGGFGHVVWEDEGDKALARYDRDQPDLVIVGAGLDRGDARELIATMRARPGGRETKLILIGETDGPVRNALDASDFAVDRFVSRPLAGNALLFAVRTCAEAVASERQAAASTDTRLERKMESAMNEAIDDFVRAAMDALPPASKSSRSRVPRSTLVATPPPPVPGAATAAPARTPPQASGAASSAAEENAGESAQPDDQPGGGAFARELRRKMSMMAERLFPGQRVEQSVNMDLAHDHSAEIDLSSFGVDTVSGIDDDEDDDDDDAVLDTPPPSSPQISLPPLPAAAPAPAIPAAAPVAAASPVPAVLSIPPVPTLPARSVAPAPARPAAATPPRRAQSDAGVSAEPAASAVPESPLGGDLSGDALAAEGPIRRGEADAAILIERMYRRRFTGRVSFQQPLAAPDAERALVSAGAGQKHVAEKEILFDKGRPVFASSTLAHDRMGEQLLREGKITQEQFESVRSLVNQSGRRMGEVLIEMGWLKRRELLPVVRRHIEDIVYSLFAWDSGRYAVTEGDFAAAERIRISRHPAAMVLEGVRRKFDLETLEALLGSPESIIEIIDERKLKAVVSVADLSSAERKVIASFDGERRLLDVHRATSVDLVEVYQLGYGLVVWGAAQSLRRGDEGQILLPEEPALVGETDLAIDRQRVLAKYALVIEADYFSLLGVRRDATSFEIKRAYEAARRDYASEGFPPEVRSELSAEIAEIAEVLEEAYRVLRDDGMRTSYLNNLR